MRQAMLAFAVAAALAACSGSDSSPSAPPPPGCDRIAMLGTCYSDPAATVSSCTADYGTWRPEGCTGANLVGMCFGSNGRTTYYYSPSYASYFASLSCSGSFVAMGARVTGWCDLRALASMDHMCLDVAGTESDMAMMQWPSQCASLGGDWHTTDACPTAGRTGTCSSVGGGIEFYGRVYDPATAAADAASCVSGGDTWTPG